MAGQMFLLFSFFFQIITKFLVYEWRKGMEVVEIPLHEAKKARNKREEEFSHLLCLIRAPKGETLTASLYKYFIVRYGSQGILKLF